jgi:DNA-binding transcriptional MerR regulator
VKKLAHISGVSVRTLHHYDRIGLLKPSIRTQARYRLYGEPQLLRLQQILFYKELDFSLEEIRAILDDPDFDMVKALEDHKSSLIAKGKRIEELLSTNDKTILKLKGKIMLKDEELYAGLSNEKIESYRKEVTEKYGVEALETSEKSLKQMNKADFEKLKTESEKIYNALAGLMNADPKSKDVQDLVEKHYKIIRTFWGTASSKDPQWDAYKGLGELYVSDPNYTQINARPSVEFAAFMKEAMGHFADRKSSE